MANEGDNYLTFGSFRIISGVPIKISEKFRQPEKITLPSCWKDIDTSELLRYQYDFDREKKALAQAEEERLNHARQKRQREDELRQKEKERLKEEERLKKEKEEEESLKNEELQKIYRIKQGTEAQFNGITLRSDTVTLTTNTRPTTTTSTIEILTPLVVSNSSVQKQQQQNHLFDPLEFENQNDNPFEFVERATLNEFDELRSVLEPETNVVKSAPEVDNGKSDEFELSSVFFNPTPSVDIPNVGNIIPVAENISSLHEEHDHDYTNEGFDCIPHQPSKGTLTWTHFGPNGSQQVINPFNPLNPFQANFHSPEGKENSYGHQQQATMSHSKTPPPSVGHRHMMGTSSDGMLDTECDYENTVSLPRTKSLPNLQEQNNEFENTENVSFLKTSDELGFGVKFMNSQEKSTLSQQQQQQPIQQAVPTDRIENIMKQFQFQRMGAVSSSSSQIPLSNSHVTSLQNTTSLDDTVINDYASHTSSTNPFGAAMPTYVPPYMISTSNSANIMNYQQQPLDQTRTSYLASQNDYSGGGPMLIQSRLAISSQNSANIDSDSVINLNSVSSESSMTRPSSNIFPPISNLKNTQRVYTVPTFGSSQLSINTSSIIPPPVPYPRQSTEKKISFPSETISPPKRPTSAKLPNIDLKTSPAPPLPNIPSSFLQDPYISLSTSEKNFANQLNAMGFPLPCISRTIKRLGMDEKEVLDFLVLVEELKENTKQNGDDVEMALQNNENDKVKSTAYLEMVAMFRELGFQQQSIHEALQESSCDQNKALDYLTR